jgi:hypothetical protein
MGPPMPGAPQPPKKKGRGKTVAIFLAAFVVVLIVIGAASGGSSTKTPATVAAAPAKVSASGPVKDLATEAAPAVTHAAPKPKPKPQADTVTYVVNGSSAADVTYGPSGSSFTGHAPMNVTKKLGSPPYYSITAQLQGSGSVSCEIKVNGKVMSKGTASGGYNIASCEIVSDFSGGWTDANSS